MVTARMLPFVHRFCKNESGGVLIMVGIALVILIAAAGAGVDFGFTSLARNKVQASADLAATSAGGYENPDGSATTEANREAVGDRFYSLNFRKSYMGVDAAGTGNNPASGITDVTGNMVKVNPTAKSIDSHFIQLAGPNAQTVDGDSTVRFNALQPLAHDVILVMDYSGSMCWPFNHLDANNNVIDCNTFIGSPLRRIIAEGNAAKYLADNLLTAANDALPATQQNRISTVFWTDGNPPGSTPFWTSNAQVTSFLNSLVGAHTGYSGSTNSTTGLLRAKQIATNSIPGFPTAPWNPDAAKIIVFMTDGVNNNPAIMNASSLALCNEFKDSGATIYALAMGDEASGNMAVRNFISSCASGQGGASNGYANLGSFFYVAPTQADLDQAFANILQNIKKVRIQE